MSFQTVRRRTGLIVLTLSLVATGWSLPGRALDVKPKPAAVQDQPKAKTAKASVSTAHGAHSRKGKAAKPAKLAVEPVPPEAVEPPAPNWPANAAAVPATVGWNGRQLQIAAENSSLSQILHDISTATGVKVEGLGNDQRIFGSYGPADPRDVLAKLLDGSGYNVLMIGDQGSGTPREIVLTAQQRPAGHGAPGQAGGDAQTTPGGDDEEPEQPEPPEQQQIMAPRPQFNGVPQPPQGAPGQPRNPQQLIQELQQRQQQLLQQQQQQGPPPQQPE
jgi:hypothetical protein